MKIGFIGLGNVGGKLAESWTKGNPGNGGGDFTGHATNTGRRPHLGIKCLGLRGATMHEEKNDCLVLSHTTQLLDGILCLE